MNRDWVKVAAAHSGAGVNSTVHLFQSLTMKHGVGCKLGQTTQMKQMCVIVFFAQNVEALVRANTCVINLVSHQVTLPWICCFCSPNNG